MHLEGASKGEGTSTLSLPHYYSYSYHGFGLLRTMQMDFRDAAPGELTWIGLQSPNQENKASCLAGHVRHNSTSSDSSGPREGSSWSLYVLPFVTVTERAGEERGLGPTTPQRTLAPTPPDVLRVWLTPRLLDAGVNAPNFIHVHPKQTR